MSSNPDRRPGPTPGSRRAHSAPRHTGPLALAGLGAAAVLAVAAVLGGAPADGAPSTDGQGFVDSTARCAAPSVAVAYGETSSSRVAICSTDGRYEYRGVRVRDGARLVTPATTADGGYRAVNDGITYTVTAAALTVESGGTRIRREAWTLYRTPGTSGTTAPPTTTAASPTTSPSALPSTTSTPAPAPAPTPTPNPAPTSTALPPPLPAEVGGTR